MLILGILDQLAAPVGDFESIATVTVTAATQTSIEFTNIPATYQHLQIRGVARSNNAAFWGGIELQFNSDTAANYAFHNLIGNGTNATSDATINSSLIYAGFGNVGSSATSNIFGATIMDILDYANTNKNKTIRILSGRDLNGGGSEDRIALTSGLWRKSPIEAISSIKLTSQSSSFVTNTRFALYGIRG